MFRRTFVTMVLVGLAAMGLALASCGEASDDPEDCTPEEFFDEATELCTPCPAVGKPDCAEGCGFRVVDDEFGCPVAECATECDLCPEDFYFAEDTLRCERCSTAIDPPEICFQDQR